MFTGLVEERAKVVTADFENSKEGQTLRLIVAAPVVSQDAKLGDSICVSGCCLTVVKKSRDQLTFQAGDETLSRTMFGGLKAGDAVNLERSLRLGDRLGGHMVSGHIDGIGSVVRIREDNDWRNVMFRVPMRLSRHLAPKGSITVDGVSLTVVNVEVDRFSVALIPHTLQNTTLDALEVGTRVNIETDLIAKYLERLIEARQADDSLRSVTRRA